MTTSIPQDQILDDDQPMEADGDPQGAVSGDEQAGPSENPAEELETGVVWSRLLFLVAFFVFIAVVGGRNAMFFVAGIGAALFIHEGGHFLAGRWSGMLVTEYFIGFGPRIFSFRRGETVYGLKAIPLGAYVRIVGMSSLEDVHPANEARTYRQAAWHKRVITILAGPATHFVIAAFLMVIYLMTNGALVADEEAWAIGDVVPGSVAEEAGLQSRDQIVAINGQELNLWEDLSGTIQGIDGELTDFTVLRDGETFDLQVRVGERLSQLGAQGLNGLYYGDFIRTFEGEPVENYAQFADLASDRVGEQVSVGIQRGPSVIDQLVEIDEVAPDSGNATLGFLGVTRGPAFDAPLSIGGAVVEAPQQLGSFISDIAQRTPRLVTTRDGLRSTFGLTAFDSPPVQESVLDENGLVIEFRPVDLPNIDQDRPVSLIGLTRIASIVEDGSFVLFLVIVINIFFGMFNLVPLLPLDGGHIAIATYEKIRSVISGTRHAADPNKLLPVTYAVFGLLIVVQIIAVVRDIYEIVAF